MNNGPLPHTKSMENKARGTIEVYSKNDICAVCWVDKKVVTLALNNLNPWANSKLQPILSSEKAKNHHRSAISDKTEQWAYGRSGLSRFVP